MYKPKAKYGNKKTTYNGIVFDSKKECTRYMELLSSERLGHITELRRQVSYELIPSQRERDTANARGVAVKGKVIERPTKYIADFVYMRNGKTVVEDTKGFRTSDYIIKRKLMLYVHGIRIQEI